VDITVLGNELRVVEGSYEHTVTDDITQKSTTGSMIRSAFVNIAEEAVEGYSVKSNTVDIRAETTTTLKSETSYTNSVGTTIVETAGTSISSTTATHTIVGTTKVDINPS